MKRRTAREIELEGRRRKAEEGTSKSGKGKAKGGEEKVVDVDHADAFLLAPFDPNLVYGFVSTISLAPFQHKLTHSPDYSLVHSSQGYPMQDGGVAASVNISGDTKGDGTIQCVPPFLPLLS